MISFTLYFILYFYWCLDSCADHLKLTSQNIVEQYATAYLSNQKITLFGSNCEWDYYPSRFIIILTRSLHYFSIQPAFQTSLEPPAPGSCQSYESGLLIHRINNKVLSAFSHTTSLSDFTKWTLIPEIGILPNALSTSDRSYMRFIFPCVSLLLLYRSG